MEPKDRKVKGTMLLDYARIIHSTKDRDWGKHLTEEELELINGRIMASVWYPYEIFMKAGMAVYKEIAKENLAIVRNFGKFNADTLFQGTYKSTLEAVLAKGGGVFKFLERYGLMTPNLVSFASLDVKNVSDKRVSLTLAIDFELPKMMADAYCNQLAGTIGRLAELAGGKYVKVALMIKNDQSSTRAEYDVTWE